MERDDEVHYVKGGLKLFGEFMKETFISGLKDDRIKYMVKSKGETPSLAQLVETAIQEESEVRPNRYKNNLRTQWQGQTFIEKENQFRIKREVNLATEQATCYKCLEKGHLERFCNNNAKYENCGKVWHQSRNCRSNKVK